MSRLLRKRPLVIFVSLLIFVVGVWAFFKIQDSASKKNIENEYGKVSIPNEFIFQKKEWIAGSIDVTEYMRYFYLFDGSQEKAVSDFSATLTKVGFKQEDRYRSALDQAAAYKKCPSIIYMYYIPVSDNPHFYQIKLPAVGKANILIEVYDYGDNCLDD